MKYIKLVTCAVICYLSTDSLSAGVIYSEDFSSDPGFTTTSALGSSAYDQAVWKSSSDTYEIYLQDTSDFRYKYAFSQMFDVVENKSFRTSYDFRTAFSSVGMDTNIFFIDSAVQTSVFL